jgi:hypothetical protein
MKSVIRFSTAMAVLVVNIRPVRVPMNLSRMTVHVTVCAEHGRIVSVQVMTIVVPVSVLVLDGGMDVLVRMPLGEVQKDADTKQKRRTRRRHQWRTITHQERE